MYYFINLTKELFKALPEKRKKNLVLIFFALALSGFLETVGIGLIIPLISEILGTSIDIFSIKGLFNFHGLDKKTIIINLSIITIFVYLVKGIYLTLLEFYIQKFVQRIKVEISLKLYKKYINNDYELNVNTNSTILFRNLTTEATNFTSGIVEPIIMIAKEFFIIVMLLVFVITINYKVSILIIVFSIIFVFIIKSLLSRKLESLGLIEQEVKGKLNKVMLESLQGIKIIKAYNLENLFKIKLRELSIYMGNTKAKANSIKLLPRLWIEFILIIFLLILGISFIYSGYTIMEFTLFSSIFLIAMLKVMPAILSSLRVLNQLSSYKASINLIKKELEENTEKDLTKDDEVDKKKKSNLSEFTKQFSCKEITFKYLASEEIIKDLSFEISRKNDIIGISGESGSGKTTLVDIFIGLLNPNKGTFYIDDKKVEIQDCKNIFGYVPQTTFLFDDTIKNNILMSFDEKFSVSDNLLKEVLEKTQLTDLVNSLKDKENAIIGENGAKISGGQKQRIGIARALVRKPKILIIDEATNGLDKNTEKKIFEDLKVISKDLSIIVISHNPQIWNYCNKLFEMKNKNLVKIK
jgi:ABC-type multidrug transport system fused ATPase/permease subunit